MRGMAYPSSSLHGRTDIAVLTAAACIMDDDLEAAEHGLADGQSSFHKVNLQSLNVNRVP